MRDVDESRGRTGVPRRHSGDACGSQRQEDRAGAQAEDHHRHCNPREVRRAEREAAQPEHADERERDADDQEARRADAGHQSRHDEHEREHREAQREEREARPERAVAIHALEELRHEEEHPEHPADEHDPRDVRAGALATREQTQGRDRLLGAQLRQHERGEEQDPGREGRKRDALAPPGRAGADEAVDERCHAERRRHGSPQIEVSLAPLGLRQDPRREPDQRDADRHVDEQAPAP